MRRASSLYSYKSPQSVKPLEDEEDCFESSFLNPQTPIYSVLKPSHKPTKQRILYLWKRLRIMIGSLAKIIKVWKDIQLYGGSRNHYCVGYARKESKDVDEFETVEKFVFVPRDWFLKIWSLIILVLLLYTGSYLPYRLCFYENESIEWYIFDNCTDFVFFFDVIITFNSAYYNKNKKLVTNRKKIALTYVKSWFFIDLTACIPIQALIPSNKSYNKLVRIARLPRLYKILRFLKIFKLIETVKSINCFNKIFEYLRMTEGILRLMYFFIAVLLAVHINGCIWYFIARVDDASPENWVFRYGLLDSTLPDLYLFSIYFVMQTISTIGFGDIVPVTIYERIYTLFLMFIGIGFYSYIVGNLYNILKTIDSYEIKNKNMLAGLNQFAKATKLPSSLKNKIKLYIETYARTAAQQFDKDILLKELPTGLKKELNIHLYKKVVEKILFFQDKDSQFISSFVDKIKTIELNSKEIIYTIGEYAEEIYFISKGRVVMKSDKKVIFKSYMQGSYFGELEVLSGSLRKSTVEVASSKAVLLAISKKDFFVIMKDYPEVLSEMKATAKIREMKHTETLKFMLKTMSSGENELNKAKTTLQFKEKNALKPFGKNQNSEKNLKNSLGVETSSVINYEPPQSIWEKYNSLKQTKNLSRRFVSMNSMHELDERVSCAAINTIKNPFNLPKNTFAGSFTRPRILKNTKFDLELDTDKSYSYATDQSREENSFSLGTVLKDLRENEQTANEKFKNLNDMLKSIHCDQIKFKNKLEKFFVYYYSIISCLHIN